MHRKAVLELARWLRAPAFKHCLEAQRDASFRPLMSLAAHPPCACRSVAPPFSAMPNQWRPQGRTMFIQTQPTPNPSSLMFLPGKQVMESGSTDFTSAREAMVSPLASKLFRIDGVLGVFFGSDFITIKKQEDISWSLLKPEVFAAIMDHFTSSEPLFLEGHTSPSDTAISPDDSEVVAMIKELLETRIKPAVMEDGGDILFVSFEEDTGVVTLKMQGACSGCPSSAVTLKSGIENMLMHYIPEVKEVVQAESEAETVGVAAFNAFEKHLSN